MDAEEDEDLSRNRPIESTRNTTVYGALMCFSLVALHQRRRLPRDLLFAVGPAIACKLGAPPRLRQSSRKPGMNIRNCSLHPGLPRTSIQLHQDLMAPSLPGSDLCPPTFARKEGLVSTLHRDSETRTRTIGVASKAVRRPARPAGRPRLRCPEILISAQLDFAVRPVRRVRYSSS